MLNKEDHKDLRCDLCLRNGVNLKNCDNCNNLVCALCRVSDDDNLVTLCDHCEDKGFRTKLLEKIKKKLKRQK